ncbi:MAG: DNA-binding protein WhiA [Clostridia bacterium]|jgi:DNA-binding protein WhiA
MSFSSDLKEELSKISNLNKKDEVKYELIGYLISKNASVVKNNVRYATESEYNINRFSKLLRNLDIDNNIEFDGKSFIITFKVKNLIQEVKVVENQLEIKSNVDSEDIKKISRVQSEKLIQNDRNNKLIIMENDNCKRAIVRGAFLGAGSINNPSRTYHLEINLSTKNNMEFLDEILKQCNIRCKKLENNNSIYLKDGEEISAIIALFGASSSVLKFEDIRVQKEMNGKVNRIVNCQSANLNKTLNASVEQIDAIRRLQQSNKFNNLDDNLKEIALLRLEYPDMSLVELGKKLKEPLGKSGVNYRLKRIIKIAEDL